MALATLVALKLKKQWLWEVYFGSRDCEVIVNTVVKIMATEDSQQDKRESRVRGATLRKREQRSSEKTAMVKELLCHAILVLGINCNTLLLLVKSSKARFATLRSIMPQALFSSGLDHTYIWALCVRDLLCVCINLQKKKKLVVLTTEWLHPVCIQAEQTVVMRFTLVVETNCIRQPERQLPWYIINLARLPYNHNTLRTLRTSVSESLQMHSSKMYYSGLRWPCKMWTKKLCSWT